MTPKDVPSPCKKHLRSRSADQLQQLDWKESCFLCGHFAYHDKRHPKQKPIHQVETIPFIDQITEQCDQGNDAWAKDVHSRIEGCIDFVAAEARYHSKCYFAFMQSVSSKISVGRPKDERMLGCFNSLCIWLENESDTELYTVDEL